MYTPVGAAFHRVRNPLVFVRFARRDPCFRVVLVAWTELTEGPNLPVIC